MFMSAGAVKEVAGEIGVLRNQARTTERVVQMNVEGITHEESLIRPEPGGNCLNWVIGHLACVYNNVLPLLGQNSVVQKSVLKRYERGAAPLEIADEAVALDELLATITEAVNRFEAGLAGLTPERLDEPAGFSPTNNPNETVRSLLATVCFHQAYHAGQTGTLRRLAGKKGAIA
jgi:DinB superfamily